MNIRKITVVFLATAMVSIGFGITISDNVQGAFVDTLSGNGLIGAFTPYDTAWNDAGTMAVVVGHEGATFQQNAYAYFPGNDTYFPLTNYYGTQTLYGVEYSYERVIPTPDVLIVDADYAEEGIASVYDSALSTCNANIVLWDVWSGGVPNMGKPAAGTMRNYDVVIWVPTRDMNGIGGVGDAFNSADETEVETYLNLGGNFMLSNIYYTDYTDGASYAYAPGDFAYDNFGINHITNPWSIYDEYINETVGDLVYDGIGTQMMDWWINGWSGSPDNNDYMFPSNGEVCFYGTDSIMTTYRSMGIRYDQGDFKSTFFGFPFEAISSNSAREDIMEMTLEWFMPGSQGPTRQSTVLVVDADYNEDGLADAYEWSLTNNSWDVTTWDVYPDDIKPTTADMIGYDLVVWVPSRDMQGSGGGGDAFDSLDEGQVSGYLGTGGNFFLSNIYWSDWTSGGGAYGAGDFANDVFGIGNMNNMGSGYEDYAQGWGGDAVFDSFGSAWYDWSRYNWGGSKPGACDEINTMSATSCMEIVNDAPYMSYTGGVRWDQGIFKSMFMGFPFETFQLASDRDDFWARALEWFVPGSTDWDPSSFTYQDVWWVCGDDAAVGWNTVYRVVPSEGLTLQAVGTANVFQDVSCDYLGNPLFVSRGRSDMQYYDYFSGTWSTVTTGLIMADYDFRGVDFNENDRRFYLAGERNTDSMATMWYTDVAPLDSGSAQAYEFNYLPQEWAILYSIAWNQGLDYGLAVGDNMVYKVQPYDYYANGTLGYSVINTTFGIAYDVAWDTDGYNEASIVGYKLGVLKGAYWRYYDTNPQLLEGYLNPVPGEYYYSCAMKPPSSPKWLFIPASSGGVQINVEAKDESGTLTVGADQPHIFIVNMWKQVDGAQGSVLNNQVDADTTYTFFIEGNYTIGGVDNWNNLEIDLTAWYDGNGVGATSPGDPTWSLDTFRTRQFNISYDPNTGIDTMLYPVAGGSPPEFQVQSLWQDPTNYGPDNSWYRLYINVTFGAQTFVANSDFATGAATRPWDQNFAHNDADSWDFSVTAFNTGAPSARNYSYEEFGINDFASISVSGNPGGSAPPGTANFALTNPSVISYSTNSMYYVNVSVPNLLKGGVGPQFIDATNVAVQNTHSAAAPANSDTSAQTSFPGPGLDLCVWGSATPTPLAPVYNGTESAGPGYSDYTADFLSEAFETTEIYWWVTIPASTPEGTYTGTITITLWGG